MVNASGIESSSHGAHPSPVTVTSVPGVAEVGNTCAADSSQRISGDPIGMDGVPTSQPARATAAIANALIAARRLAPVLNVYGKEITRPQCAR
jgi:hypothetical protein